ncbi:MAG: DUF4340 domain-containing protein [Planctomycetes bacterium]|nr:DUF4340 domain-containing protein [Planctomycetota bacterium]
MKQPAVILLMCALLTSLLAWWPSEQQGQGQELQQQHLAAGVNAEDVFRIRMTSWDAREMSSRSLELSLENERWVLPQYGSYPADASQRVGELAGTLLGIRLGVPLSAERTSGDAVKRNLFAECRLYDPSNAQEQRSGFGTRVQMWTADNALVLDLIIGGEVKDDVSQHYVRRQDDQNIYRIPWNLDLPLRFVDWVDRSVTHIEKSDIRTLKLDLYSFKMRDGKMQKVKVPTVSFTRGNVQGLWDSANADPGKKVNDAAVQSMMRSLLNGTFHGVRARSNDVKELSNYGFYFLRRGCYAEEGAVSLIAKDGITYNFFMGKEVAGAERRELSTSLDYRYLMVICSYDFEADRVRPNDNIGEKNTAGRAAAAELNKRFANYIYIIDDVNYRELHPRIETMFMVEEQKE